MAGERKVLGEVVLRVIREDEDLERRHPDLDPLGRFVDQAVVVVVRAVGIHLHCIGGFAPSAVRPGPKRTLQEVESHEPARHRVLGIDVSDVVRVGRVRVVLVEDVLVEYEAAAVVGRAPHVRVAGHAQVQVGQRRGVAVRHVVLEEDDVAVPGQSPGVGGLVDFDAHRSRRLARGMERRVAVVEHGPGIGHGDRLLRDIVEVAPDGVVSLRDAQRGQHRVLECGREVARIRRPVVWVDVATLEGARTVPARRVIVTAGRHLGRARVRVVAVRDKRVLARRGPLDAADPDPRSVDVHVTGTNRPLTARPADGIPERTVVRYRQPPLVALVPLEVVDAWRLRRARRGPGQEGLNRQGRQEYEEENPHRQFCLLPSAF